MFEHGKINDLDDFFKTLSNRTEKKVYFYRITKHDIIVDWFIKKYYEAARMQGVVIEGKIQNPTEQNLSYFNEIMGMNFIPDKSFLDLSLKKWLPRMNDYQRTSVVEALFTYFEMMKKSGKNDNMLKNAYIKFMCWLYYKFERVVNCLGDDKVPKILYEGDISNYELMLISVLSMAGCDVVLLEYNGDDAYLKLDPNSESSELLTLYGQDPFPANYSLKNIRAEMDAEIKRQKLYGPKPEKVNSTNTWISGTGFNDCLKFALSRGSEPGYFYNCFYRICGVPDKLTYQNDYFEYYKEMKDDERNILIIDEKNKMYPPNNDEITSIKRKNCNSVDEVCADLIKNFSYISDMDLKSMIVKGFVDILMEEAAKPNANVNRITNKGVYLVCWFKRYHKELFGNYKKDSISVFIKVGGCENENEALFVRFLARLPIDVIILTPDEARNCVLTDPVLKEVSYVDSANMKVFPREKVNIAVGTDAYNAVQALEAGTNMYAGDGLYGAVAYNKATAVTLKTTMEEVALIWGQEIKDRPSFSTDDSGHVQLPVLFTKVSGVKDRDINQYWLDIKAFFDPDTYVTAFTKRTQGNIYQNGGGPRSHATEFFKNGKLLKDKIKMHPSYQYGFLSETMQNHILDKLELLINSRLIKGTFENGMEYTIITTVLNLNTGLIRMFQKLDFTKKNPKYIYIHTTEDVISVEDSIILAFLNLACFDVMIFVPTGYHNIERYYANVLIDEHIVGDFVYDLHIPDFRTIKAKKNGSSWHEKIFKNKNNTNNNNNQNYGPTYNPTNNWRP